MEGPTRSSVFWIGLLAYGLAQYAGRWVYRMLFGQWTTRETVALLVFVAVIVFFKLGAH